MGKPTINGKEVEAGDGGVHFVKDPDTGEMILFHGDVAVKLAPSNEGNDGASTGAPSAKLSEAEQWLADLEAEQASLPDVEKFHLGGRDWFIKRGAAEDITQAGLWMMRDATGQMNLLAKDTMATLFAALFLIFLVQSEKDKRGVFDTYLSAYKQAISKHPKVIEANILLYNEIGRINPGCVPRLDMDSADTVVEDDAAPLDEAQVTSK